MELDGDNTDDKAMVEDGTYRQTIMAVGRHHRRAALADWIKMKRSALHAVEKHVRELKAQMKNLMDEEGLVTDEMVSLHNCGT